MSIWEIVGEIEEAGFRVIHTKQWRKGGEWYITISGYEKQLEEASKLFNGKTVVDYDGNICPIYIAIKG